MALKGQRVTIEEDITLTCNVASTRGFMAVYATAGSGIALGDRAGVCTIASTSSGYKPAGILMNDVVDIDTTKYQLNPHKDETLINERVTLLRKGRITTNALVSGQTPTAGDKAYLGATGKLTGSYVNDVATPRVGTFIAAKDENGYVTADINLPM